METYYEVSFIDKKSFKLKRIEVEASNILAAISLVYELNGYVLIKKIELK